MVCDMSIERFPKTCSDCGEDFLAKVGNQKYCSSCKKERSERGRGKGTSYKYSKRICKSCEKPFDPTSGNQIYCKYCRAEKKKERDKARREKKRLNRIEPTFICPMCDREYKKTGNNQKYCLDCNKKEKHRKIAFEHYKEYSCHRCGWDKWESLSELHVHHKDRNKKNNSIENLEILCSKCHRHEHMVRCKTTGKIITNL